MIKKTKIIATIGPASSNKNILKKMFNAGVNIIRLNFSHSNHDTHKKTLDLIRNASVHLRSPIAIIQDLAGPKIRTGEHKGVIFLKRGKMIILTTKKCVGDTTKLYVNYKNLPKEVKKGNIILLDDGRKKLQVLSVTDLDIKCKILIGGEIIERRGVNIPEISIKISSLTKKDKKDVLFGVKNNVDFIALSFVRRASDIKQLRRIIIKEQGDIGIIAKIETRDAILNIDEIIKEADGIMIARGDLAVEAQPEEVPILQKLIINKCKIAGKPVITATQMLESMIQSPVPTRAEVSDVANSILDGTDAVMLSAETAMGEYPIEAVKIMSTIANKTEQEYLCGKLLKRTISASKTGKTKTVDVITRYVVETARDTNAKIIVALTETGSTARMIARYHPKQPVIVMSPNDKVLKRIVLSFGCYSQKIKYFKYAEEALERISEVLIKENLIKPGDKFVLSAGMPFRQTGGTNMIMVKKV